MSTATSSTGKEPITYRAKLSAESIKTAYSEAVSYTSSDKVDFSIVYASWYRNTRQKHQFFVLIWMWSPAHSHSLTYAHGCAYQPRTTGRGKGRPVNSSHLPHFVVLIVRPGEKACNFCQRAQGHGQNTKSFPTTQQQQLFLPWQHRRNERTSSRPLQTSLDYQRTPRHPRPAHRYWTTHAHHRHLTHRKHYHLNIFNLTRCHSQLSQTPYISLHTSSHYKHYRHVNMRGPQSYHRAQWRPNRQLHSKRAPRPCTRNHPRLHLLRTRAPGKQIDQSQKDYNTS